jgi:hypothetical protein
MSQTTEPLPTATERFNCPTCEGAIDRAEVLITRINGGRYAPAKQKIRFHCEHCRCVAEIKRTRNGGIWQIDAFRPITEEKERAAVLDGIEKHRARCQMEAA